MSEHDRRLSERIEEGLFFYGVGKVHEAIACWRKVVETDPRNERALDYLESAGVDVSSLRGAEAVAFEGQRSSPRARAVLPRPAGLVAPPPIPAVSPGAGTPSPARSDRPAGSPRPFGFPRGSAALPGLREFLDALPKNVAASSRGTGRLDGTLAGSPPAPPAARPAATPADARSPSSAGSAMGGAVAGGRPAVAAPRAAPPAAPILSGTLFRAGAAPVSFRTRPAPAPSIVDLSPVAGPSAAGGPAAATPVRRDTVASIPQLPPEPAGAEDGIAAAARLFREGRIEDSYARLEREARERPAVDETLRRALEGTRKAYLLALTNQWRASVLVPRRKRAPTEAMRLDLSGEAGYLFARIDGVTTVDDLIAGSGLDPFVALRALQRLLQQDAIDVLG